VKVSWPIGRSPRPGINSRLLLIVENLAFRVTTATANAGSPLSAEIHVTAVRE
jgi:hypothetical protein